MTAIHQLRASLDAAEANYRSADIEHPTAVHLAKEALTRARHEYWTACADLVERLPDLIVIDGLYPRIAPRMFGVYVDITGEQL